MGDWTNHRQRLFDRGRGFKKKGKYFVKHGTSDKDGNACRHLFDSCYPVKNEGTRHSAKRTSSLTPEGKERRPALGRGCTLLSFLGRAGKLRIAFCLCFVLLALCVPVFPKLLIYPGATCQQAERRRSWTRIESLLYATGGQTFSRLSEDGEDKQRPV